ncbi:alpha/beta hydrolase family protein [Neorickettsia helminthoeca str. Oregon]|uniref:Alpha/beta hydrolase family protein n=1 Tax=Neorickettsia helminthoeca str. Oregon TaxID=1286528 RepID=X5H4P7_9RICK|nr:hypothetical protein [Neorickettsia helminthoeca]AHX11526.1 alpha/beta hydrolase family protein [Neorickettsia helminthoeca str. Oregon]
MSKTPIIFCHGWGFDDRFWNPIIHMFEQDRVCALSLGYFHSQNAGEIMETKNHCIGVCHSLGMMKLISLFGNKLTHLIGINSFVNFLGNESDLHRKRSLILETMIRNFTRDPMRTLKKFQSSVLDGESSPEYKNQQIPKGAPNFSVLSSDLEKLRLDQCISDIPILIIGSIDDKVVPVELIHDNFPGQKKVIFEKGGHNTIGKIPSLVYKEITSFLYSQDVL